MKLFRTVVTAIVWCSVMNQAYAGTRCAAPEEALALKAAAVQQQLMVAAFMCHDGDAYNRFVVTYRGDLQRSDATLKTYFVRRGGEAQYDTYKTRAANLSALAQARDDRTFCAVAGQLFAAALERQAPLAAFVAAAPSAPGFMDVCIDHLKDTRGSVHMAAVSREPAATDK